MEVSVKMRTHKRVRRPNLRRYVVKFGLGAGQWTLTAAKLRELCDMFSDLLEGEVAANGSFRVSRTSTGDYTISQTRPSGTRTGFITEANMSDLLLAADEILNEHAAIRLEERLIRTSRKCSSRAAYDSERHCVYTSCTEDENGAVTTNLPLPHPVRRGAPEGSEPLQNNNSNQ